MTLTGDRNLSQRHCVNTSNISRIHLHYVTVQGTEYGTLHDELSGRY